MDVPLLICALFFVGIGVDILRFPRQPPPTQQQDDEAIFGKADAILMRGINMMRRTYLRCFERYGGVPRTNEMRVLAAILLVTGLVLGARSVGVI
jgi:hypothetical protein